MKTYTATGCYSSLNPEELLAEASTVESRLTDLRAQIARLSEQAMQLVAEQQAIADVQTTHKLAEPGEMDWAWVLADDPQNSAVRYKAATKAIHGLGEHDQGHAGLSAQGVNAHTGQRVPRVSLLRGAPELTRKVQTGLEKLLPHIIPCKPGRSRDDVKYVSVFEATLSEFGSYFLAIDESKAVFELRKKGYGSGNVVHAAATLGALLDFVEQHCYYEDWTNRVPA